MWLQLRRRSGGEEGGEDQGVEALAARLVQEATRCPACRDGKAYAAALCKVSNRCRVHGLIIIKSDSCMRRSVVCGCDPSAHFQTHKCHDLYVRAPPCM